jgi:hypothetical protein
MSKPNSYPLIVHRSCMCESVDNRLSLLRNEPPGVL